MAVNTTSKYCSAYCERKEVAIIGMYRLKVRIDLKI